MLAKNIKGNIKDTLSFELLHYFAKQNQKYHTFCIRPFSCNYRAYEYATA